MSSMFGRRKTVKKMSLRSLSACRPRLESLEDRALPSNLVVNGDFEAGNRDFSTDYRYSPASIQGFQEYAITRNPRLVHDQATSFGDHTSGSGQMMAVNGPLSSDNLTVWAQTVPVQTNTTYTLSAWVASWTNYPPELNALLSFSINGRSLGTFRAPSPAAIWERFSATWDSVSNTSASIRIVVLNPGEFIANDFALDDISLSGGPSCLPGMVTNTDSSGPCSLREAIVWANSNPGRDTIRFNIPGPGVKRISLASPLPAITGPVVIDGYSQPGATANTLPVGNNANLLIEINGGRLGAGSSCLTLSGGNSEVKGLVINGCPVSGIDIRSSNNTIGGNYIGTNVQGTAAVANLWGITVYNSPGNVIGSTNPADRNLISGNADGGGVHISGANATVNRVEGNHIGTNAAGAARLPNLRGLDVRSSSNVIARNVVSGNIHYGVYLLGAGAAGNSVQGNLLGTNAAGNTALPNGWDGVAIESAPNNTIGGTTAASRNVISGNERYGVYIEGTGATNNYVQGNYIGTDASARGPVANLLYGVFLLNAPNNDIGGPEAGARNVVSGNLSHGILVAGSEAVSNRVKGNLIGLADDSSALGNLNGVWVESANNTIGGSTEAERNVISGNRSTGVVFARPSASGNRLQGNYIGTNVAGTAAVPNGESGVYLWDAQNNTVVDNLISGNYGAGVLIAGDAARNNRIQNNRIGTDVNGDPWGWMPNLGSGVYIDGARSNHILSNELAFNVNDGVTVFGYGNTISMNRIWDNSDLGIDHYDDGVTLDNVPVLDSAWTADGMTFVQGWLSTLLPYAEYRLEFFVNSDSDPSGYGEGMDYLGTSQVWTDENGVGYFQEGFTRFVPPGYCISATATDPDGTTWEFSNCVVVEAASGPGTGGSSGETATGLSWAEWLSPDLPAAAPTVERTSPRLSEEALELGRTMPGLSWERLTSDDLGAEFMPEYLKARAELLPSEIVSTAVFDLLWAHSV